MILKGSCQAKLFPRTQTSIFTHHRCWPNNRPLNIPAQSHCSHGSSVCCGRSHRRRASWLGPHTRCFWRSCEASLLKAKAVFYGFCDHSRRPDARLCTQRRPSNYCWPAAFPEKAESALLIPIYTPPVSPPLSSLVKGTSSQPTHIPGTVYTSGEERPRRAVLKSATGVWHTEQK